MPHKTVVHVIIRGSVGKGNIHVLLEEKSGESKTPQAILTDEHTTDALAVKLCESIIDAPLDWYVIHRKSFLQFEAGGDLHILYKVILPRETKLKREGLKWYDLATSTQFNAPANAEEQDILLEGIR